MNHKTSIFCSILAALCLLMAGATAFAQVAMPKPRAVSDAERAELLRTLAAKFAVADGAKPELNAAGAYRFAGNADFLYVDRTDIGSFLFERASYGLDPKPIDEKEYSREVLLPRLQKALRKVAPTSEAPVFAEFQDEFAGAAPMKTGAAPIDPRKSAVHVARTAAFVREIDGIPVFGSELLAGLDRDGAIGRLRVHWPKVDAALVSDAKKLRELVDGKVWQPPKDLQDPDTKILEVRAGVGHSAFADPGFSSAAVVRVLARRSARGTEYPIASTSYRYFDRDGMEVFFSAFPDSGSSGRGKAREGELPLRH